jgi:hypothetical protein
MRNIMKPKILLYIFLLFIFPLSAATEDKITIAIMDFKANGIDKPTAAVVSEILRTELINKGIFTIIERNQMDIILKEQGFQYTGCVDQSCAVEIGKLLSARKGIVGTVSMLDKKIIINGRMIDIEQGTAEFGCTKLVDSKDDLYDAVKSFAENLTSSIINDPTFITYKHNKKTPNQKKETKESISKTLKIGDRGSYQKKEIKETYKIGDRGPANGWIFYDKGNYSDGWRYLEAAPIEYNILVTWYNKRYLRTGVGLTSLGSGKSNTTTIISFQGRGRYAASLCYAYNSGDYFDWFLPSKDELNLLLTNLKHKGIPNDNSNCFWSSTEKDEDHVWTQKSFDGYQDISDKKNTNLVWPVRSF